VFELPIEIEATCPYPKRLFLTMGHKYYGSEKLEGNVIHDCRKCWVKCLAANCFKGSEMPSFLQKKKKPKFLQG
jgi:hypothetical protein